MATRGLYLLNYAIGKLKILLLLVLVKDLFLIENFSSITNSLGVATIERLMNLNPLTLAGNSSIFHGHS